MKEESESKKIEVPKQKEQFHSSESLKVTELPNQINVIILQHPQEPAKEKSTAAFCVRCLKQSTLRVGLSWRSLRAVLKRDVDPKLWGVLYLGGKRKKRGKEFELWDRKGNCLQEIPQLEGIVILDGSWSQAKTMWWRNAWLLKLNRIVLSPKSPSAYNKIRREPRRECLSSMESVTLALENLGEKSGTIQSLKDQFQKFLSSFD